MDIVSSADTLNTSSSKSLRFPYTMFTLQTRLAILGKSSSGITPIILLTFQELKTPVNHFDRTKPSQKSLSRCKWFYAPLVRLYHSNLKQKLVEPPV
jgi:hypothetical protein